MPAYSSYSFEILFIRGHGTPARTDDSLKIRKNFETGEFEIRYRDSYISKPVVHKLHHLYRQRVIDHVYLILKNLTMDEENFYQLQLNLPAMPPVLLNVEKLKDLYYRDHLLELVENGLDNLDVLEKVGLARPLASPPFVRTPTVTSTAEDEYADMPPLISFSELQQLQNARRALSPSMDRFLRSEPRTNTSTQNISAQRRSARVAEYNSRNGPGADISGTPCRHMFFNQDEDDHVDY